MTLALGIDVGGSKIAACLVDTADGRVVESRRMPTSAERGGQAVLEECLHIGAEVAGDFTSMPVGVGICELVDPSGRIKSAYTIDWRELDVAGAFGVAVKLESDVRGAAVAEAVWGAGRGCSSFVYVTVGTGVAFTLVQGGRPYLGARGNALILGAPPVETWSSGRALARRAGAASAEEVFRSDDGDELVRHGSEQLGRAMAWLVNALDPELMVVGGGLGLRDDYRAAAVQVMRSGIEAVDSRDVSVVPAELGANASAVGVAVLAAQDRAVA